MHEYDTVFGGFLVINYLSFFVLVMAELISDFHSYQRNVESLCSEVVIMFFFLVINMTLVHSSFAEEVLISNFHLFMFRLFFTYSIFS